jgi:hypothetical protein
MRRFNLALAWRVGGGTHADLSAGRVDVLNLVGERDVPALVVAVTVIQHV